MKLCVACLLAICLLSNPALAETVCDYSGEPWEDSSTRLMVVVEMDGKPITLHFNSLYYMFRHFNETQAEGHSLGSISSFSMLDYGSIGASNDQFIKGTGDTRPEGYFLWTNHELPGSSFPYIAAFSEQTKAREAMDEWGGQILDAEEMVTDLFTFFAGRHGLSEEAPAASQSSGKPASGSHGGHH